MLRKLEKKDIDILHKKLNKLTVKDKELFHPRKMGKSLAIRCYAPLENMRYLHTDK